MFRAPCARRQEVKIVLYITWYHHTETSEWSKITKITKITKIYKYEHIVVNFFIYYLLYINKRITRLHVSTTRWSPSGMTAQ